MEKLSMCRVCLVEDIRLRSIVETHLQEMYESLVLMPVYGQQFKRMRCFGHVEGMSAVITKVYEANVIGKANSPCMKSLTTVEEACEFETKDRRPILACYLCCARLQNCYELRRRCIRSEELFIRMLSCDELEPAQLQVIDNEKRLTVHKVVHLSIGHVLQMNADNVGVEALTFDDVKVEQSDPEDIDEDVLQENSAYDNIQSADSEDDPLINVKEEQSGDRTSDPTPKDFERAAQKRPEDLPSSNYKGHDLVQYVFKEFNKVTAADKTAAKSTNEVTFIHNDNNNERSTSVPHSERVQYTCDTCRQRYSSKCKLERHIRLCSDVWKRDLSRENSTSSHTHTGQRPYQCHVCEKSFSCVSKLTRHFRTHTSEKPHQCHVCKKRFACMSKLTRHMRTHTGEKPYHCDICKKPFSEKSHLSNHMRTHTGEKPHQCNLCKKSFLRTSHLSIHMRSHTGEKPYRCYICKKQCSQKSNLTKHMHKHTGEKPYQCDICKKFFSQRSSLTTHIRTHTCEKHVNQSSSRPALT